jgi:hypothetical protein
LHARCDDKESIYSGLRQCWSFGIFRYSVKRNKRLAAAFEAILFEAIQEFFMSITTENNKKSSLVGKQK